MMYITSPACIFLLAAEFLHSSVKELVKQFKGSDNSVAMTTAKPRLVFLPNLPPTTCSNKALERGAG